MENEKKTILKKIVSALFSEETINEKLMDVEVMIDGLPVNAHIVSVTEGKIDIGDEFYLLDEDGEKAETEAGDYEYNGVIISVDENGIITNIVEADAEDAPEDAPAEEMSKEKFATIASISKWDIEVDSDNIEVGTKLKELGYDGEEWRLDDGEYELEDGRKIQVDSEGIVVLITPAEGEEAPAEEAPAEEMSTETPKAEDENLEAVDLEKILAGIDALTSKLSKVELENKELSAKVEAFGKEPSAQSTDTTIKFTDYKEKTNKRKGNNGIDLSFMKK